MRRDPEILFVAFQTGARSNGGLESISQVIERYGSCPVAVLTQLEGPFTDRWRTATGDRVWVWPLGSASNRDRRRGLLRKIVGLLVYNAKVWALLGRNSSIRLVHCNDPQAFWHSVLATKLRSRPVLLNIRDTQAPGLGYVKWKVARIVSDRLLVLSREMREVIERETSWQSSITSAVEAPVDFVYSAVDGQRFHPVAESQRRERRQRLGLDQEQFTVLYPAALNEKKAQLALLEALAANREMLPPNLRFHFVGDFEPHVSGYARACAEFTVRAGLSDLVCLHGHQSNIEEWYQAADVICLASQREGLSRAMIEGLACGTPVVSFSVCSAREILTGYDCGEVVKYGDYNALIRVLGRLANEPVQRQAFGAAGAAAARQLFEPGVVVAKYRALHSSLLSKRDRMAGGLRRSNMTDETRDRPE